MTDDLDNLRPEVREALAIMDRDCPEVIDWQRTAWWTIHAELLRLARENKTMRDALEILNVDGLKQRAERAEAELATARETNKRLNRRVQIAEAGVAEKVKASAGRSLGRALANAAADAFMHERDEAMAELAALKARIAGGELGVVAGPVKYSQAPVIFAEPDRAMALIGQRVALVKVED